MASPSNPHPLIWTDDHRPAHPNIALVKYWGKQDKPGNIPATPSLSLTLSNLHTQTTVRSAGSDRLHLNGEHREDAKIARFLTALRAEFDVPPLEIDTTNNFPTGAGLASSASGFAALMTAINTHCELGLSTQACSGWARTGSASAARSLFGGLVTLQAPTWEAEPVGVSWPLSTVVAITTNQRKSVSSTEGMQRSRATSPFFDAWTESTQVDFQQAVAATHAQDFATLAEIGEHSALKMHGFMLSTRPTLLYWNDVTVRCLQTLIAMRQDGVNVFATVDAGPQVKAVCLPAAEAEVANALSAIDGVQRIVACGVGGAAEVLTADA